MVSVAKWDRLKDNLGTPKRENFEYICSIFFKLDCFYFKNFMVSVVKWDRLKDNFSTPKKKILSTFAHSFVSYIVFILKTLWYV